MIAIDSDCIIDFLKGKKEAVEIVGEYSEEIATTEINAFEVYFGIYQKHIMGKNEEQLADEFFSSLEVLPLNNIGKNASKLMVSLMKEGKIIDQNDIFIASILRENNITKLITRNAKHFSQVKDLEIIPY